ncbi:MAG TPA: DNA topoisomerase IB, partial [Thermoanaerobaculia bacterium]|nr:DNA topoisomerase IB [Thermoanaerobaculia bacterium]
AWRDVRDETKFGRMIAFAEALPKLRRRMVDDLARPGLPREKVLAAVVSLLEATLLRVGNEEYARSNQSFGLTTLRDRHAAIDGSTVRFEFRGKSGKEFKVDILDRRLARVVKRCRDLPGQDLFQYVDEAGERQAVGSGDVNAYLREVTGEEFSAKDFRTWGGTVLALGALSSLGAGEGAGEANRNVVQAVKAVAEQLGNRPAICRKYYIHPGVLDAYVDGVLAGAALAASETHYLTDGPALSPLERRTLALLRERQQAAA